MARFSPWWMYIVALSIALTGCRSLQVGNQKRTMQAPAEVVFEATVTTLRGYGFEIAKADPERGWIETTSRPVHGASVPWDRTVEQVRADIDSVGAERSRIRLLIAFADDASDGPRQRDPRKDDRGLMYSNNDGPLWQFIDASDAYDDLLDAIASRAESGR